MACGGCNHGKVEQGVKYVTALAKWAMEGSPTRSQEQVVYIFNKICADCDRFERVDDTHAHCTSCGCRISTDMARTNKIFIGTENCPLNKWPQ